MGHFTKSAMTPEQRERMDWLCRVIQAERDPEQFDKYVRELNALLEANLDRTHSPDDSQA